jgi:hypothetical protein
VSRLVASVVVVAVLTLAGVGRAETLTFLSYGGNVSHGAVRVGTTTVSPDGIGYNSAPQLRPFVQGTSTRSTTYPTNSLFAATWSYLRSTGRGAVTITPTGTNSQIGGASYANSNATFGAPGTNMSAAAYRTALSSEVALPTGVVLPAGTWVYSDYAGLEVNHNSSANYWFNSAANTEFRLYEGGVSAFFYESTPGNYVKFAEYNNVSLGQTINWSTGAASYTYSANAVAVDGWIIPATFTFAPITVVLNSEGRLNETTSPYLGMYGAAHIGNLIANFDFANAIDATVVPLPAAAWGGLMLMGLVLTRRRRSEAARS